MTAGIPSFVLLLADTRRHDPLFPPLDRPRRPSLLLISHRGQSAHPPNLPPPSAPLPTSSHSFAGLFDLVAALAAVSLACVPIVINGIGFLYRWRLTTGSPSPASSTGIQTTHPFTKVPLRNVPIPNVLIPNHFPLCVSSLPLRMPQSTPHPHSTHTAQPPGDSNRSQSRS